MKYGSAYADSSLLKGVIAWVPGEYAGMSLRRVLASGAMWSGMKVGFKIGMQMMKIFKPMEEDRKASMKDKKYVYVQILGVAQEFQGRGIGGRLIRAAISDCDRKDKILYLETETEENVTWYESFGFKLLKKITLPVIDLPMWEMIREPGS
jgi:ribosomal protein S18 acetylase RimI-like enzyme